MNISNYIEKLDDIYCQIIPYDYRLGQLWYRLTCRVWHRYSTVKPRALVDQTWCDRDVLMAHCVFEVLCNYVEKEIENIGWEADNRRVQAYDKLMELYWWWTKVYLRQAEITEEIRAGIDYCWPKTDNPKGYWGKNLGREITKEEYQLYKSWKDLVDRPFFTMATKLDEILEDKLKEVLEVRRCLWS